VNVTTNVIQDGTVITDRSVALDICARTDAIADEGRNTVVGLTGDTPSDRLGEVIN